MGGISTSSCKIFSTSQPFFDTFPQSRIHWLKEFLSDNCDQTMQLLECETSCKPFEPKDSWLKEKELSCFAYDMRNDGCVWSSFRKCIASQKKQKLQRPLASIYHSSYPKAVTLTLTLAGRSQTNVRLSQAKPKPMLLQQTGFVSKKQAFMIFAFCIVTYLKGAVEMLKRAFKICE